MVKPAPGTRPLAIPVELALRQAALRQTSVDIVAAHLAAMQRTAEDPYPSVDAIDRTMEPARRRHARQPKTVDKAFVSRSTLHSEHVRPLLATARQEWSARNGRAPPLRDRTAAGAARNAPVKPDREARLEARVAHLEAELATAHEALAAAYAEIETQLAKRRESRRSKTWGAAGAPAPAGAGAAANSADAPRAGVTG